MSDIDSEAASLEAWPSEPEGNGAAATGLANGNGKDNGKGTSRRGHRRTVTTTRRRRHQASGSTCSTASCSTT